MKGNAKCKSSRFEPPFGGLKVTYTVDLWFVGKLAVEFLLVLVELFRQLGRYEQILVEIDVFERGVCQFECKFQREWGVAHQRLLASEN